MNRVVLFLFLAFFLSIGFTNSSSSSEAYPYAGIGLHQARIGFEKGYGYELFSKSIYRKNLFLGYRFNNFFAVEFGIDRTFSKKRISIVSFPNVAGGSPIHESISPAIFESRFNLEIYSLNFIYFYEINKLKGLEFFGSMGPSFLKAYSKRKTLSLSGYKRDVTRTMKGKSTAFKASGGIQYKIKDSTIIRISGGFIDANGLYLIENDCIMSAYVTQAGTKSVYFVGFEVIFPF